ncbi:MAG: hypothetical protein K0R18_893 [Bacillales bacterium]|nr:hypothetical protein [Bacillales bacterium]
MTPYIERGFTLSELGKSEYQVHYYYDDLNKSPTKHELLQKMPILDKNTTVIRKLLDKGYLEVVEIWYSH